MSDARNHDFDGHPEAGHDFQLVLSGVHTLTDDLENAIFEAFRGGAELSCRRGTVTVDCHDWVMPGDTRAILLDAIRRTRLAVLPLGLNVVKLLPHDMVTAAEIAQRMNISREAVRLYATGQRGDGMFPGPAYASSSHRIVLWHWWEVLDWMMEHLGPEHPAVEACTREYRAWHSEVATVSAALELYSRAGEEARQLLDDLAS